MTYTDIVLADGPAVYFRLDDSIMASGSVVVDSSVNGINGSYQNGPTGTPGPYILLDQALSGSAQWPGGLGTSASYIRQTYNPALEVGTGDFCYELWCQTPGDGATYMELVSRDQNSTGNYQLFRTNPSGQPYSNTAGVATPAFGQSITDNQLHHLVYQRTNGTVQIYVDGIGLSSSAPGNTNGSGSELRVAVCDGSQGHFVGSMAHVAYYTKALSTVQIVNHYLVGIGSRTRGISYQKIVMADNPLRYWPLTEGSAGSYQDLTGGGNVTVVGSASSANPLNVGGSIGATNWASTGHGVFSSVTLSGDFSIETWVRCDSATDAYASTFGVNGTGPDINFYNSQYRFYVGYDVIIDPYSTSPGQVKHFVFTRKNNLMTLYRDGIPVTTASYSVGLSYSSLGFGNQQTLRSLVMQDVALYNVALDYRQVRAHFLSGNAVRNYGAANYIDLVLGDKPAGYWRLGETGGKFIDYTGNNNLNAVSIATYNVPGVIYGDVDGGASFNGSSSRAVVANSTILNHTSGTHECWIKTSFAIGGGVGAIIGHQWNAIVFLYQDVLQVYDWSVNQWRNSGFGPEDGQWHHIVLTFQSGVVNGTSLYVDGVLRMVTGITAIASPTDAGFGLGSGSSNLGAAAQFYTGVIDEAATYTTILTPSQVMAHYRAGVDRTHNLRGVVVS